MGSEGPNTNIFEWLILKQDRAYANVESEESMCMIMKCNTVTRMAYDKLNNILLVV